MKIITRGELGYRLTQSYSRLECEHYLPEVIWTKDVNAWPGDWEGRTILGLVGLAKATGKEPSYLEAMLDLLPDKLNERGYMGEVYPNEQISEQQLAGNSWLLRALIEYTYWKKSERLMPIIEKMVKMLYLPLCNEIDDYPIERYEQEGTYSGSIIALRGKWMLSTDMGCCYISLDGISAAYELLGWKELGVLLDKMISKFAGTDIYGLLYQTHASLSATRGIIRTYNITKKEEYLTIAEKCFELYLKKGQTENFSNRNRFQTCKWTEPCGIMDSYMCCVELFKITRKPEYIIMAHKIFYNAISHSQLPNGGFGLEKAIVSDENIGFTKNPDNTVTEAFWCCTMRGADGLAYISQNQCLYTKDEYVYLNYFDSEVSQEGTTILVKSEYPRKGKVRFKISSASNEIVRLKLFIPDYAECATAVFVDGEKKLIPENGFVQLDISGSGEFTLLFDIPFRRVECNASALREEFYKKMYGYMLLGLKDGVENEEDFVLLNETIFHDISYAETQNFKILFKK